MKGAIAEAERIASSLPSAFIPSQFSNPSNPNAHYNTTAREIWNDTQGKINIFVAGIGTGGTISGVAKYLKEKDPSIKIIGVEPASSPLISKGISGSHGLQGIGANFIPDNFDSSLVDEILCVTENDAYLSAQRLAKTEGILCGITSGAALFAATELAKKYPSAKLILAHAARAFAAWTAIDYIDELRPYANIFCDFSGVCESPAMIAILKSFGVCRCMWGTDWPISTLAGKCISLGDTFYWIGENDLRSFKSSTALNSRLVGTESLMAVREACKLTGLSRTASEDLFYNTAYNVFKK
jgi:cysteine synthase A